MVARVVTENETRGRGANPIFARLFVPIDFTIACHRAFGVALELKRAFGSTVCLFHLTMSHTTDEFLGGLGNPAGPADLLARAELRLRDFVENVAPEYVDAIELRTGLEMTPIADIQHEARRWRATLVIATAEFKAGLYRSPAEKLVHRSDIPLLLIPTTPGPTRGLDVPVDG